MKKAPILISCFFIIATGCTKNSAVTDLNKSIIGKWELTRTISGWGGEKVYAPGNGNTILFEGNNAIQYIAYNDTTFTYEGSYSIFKGKPCEFAPATTLFRFYTPDGLGYDQEIILSDGELKIGTTQCIADGGTSFYRRIE